MKWNLNTVEQETTTQLNQQELKERTNKGKSSSLIGIWIFLKNCMAWPLYVSYSNPIFWLINRPPWTCWLCPWRLQQNTEQKALGNRVLSPVYVSHELSSVRCRNVRDTFKLKKEKDLSNFNLSWIAHTLLEGKKLLSFSSFNQNHKVITYRKDHRFVFRNHYWR